MPPRVTFASSIESTITKPPESEDPKKNWYTVQDKRRFLQAALGDAHRLRGMLESGQSLAEEDFIK